MTCIRTIIRILAEIRDELVKIRKIVALRRPGTLFVKCTGYNKESGMSKFVLVLPAPGASDVVSRRLTLAVDGGEAVTQDLDGTALESEEFEAEEGSIVEGDLVDIDNAGNPSEPSTFSLELQDTIAPPKPGEVGVKMVSEE